MTEKEFFMTKKQRFLALIPFLGSILVMCIEFFSGKQKYWDMALSMFPAIGITFLSGILLGIIGLLSYIVTLIISLILIGVIWNIVFFKSLNKRDKRNHSEKESP